MQYFGAISLNLLCCYNICKRNLKLLLCIKVLKYGHRDACFYESEIKSLYPGAK